MTEENKLKDVEFIKRLCRISNYDLHNFLYKYLSKRYKKNCVYSTESFIIAKGNIPVCLVAHLDTVFDSRRARSPISEFYYDQEKSVLWSPDGMGADDRAGVFAILKILEKGYRPHIIFTQGEEQGCLGAKALVREFPKSPWKKLNYILELDRRGEKDCVFYQCGNDEFVEYVESYGFLENYGSFSDISQFGPAWGCAAANLSIGYWDEHSELERLFLDETYATIDKVIDMLEDVQKDDRSFEYIEKKQYGISIPIRSDICFVCGADIDDKLYQQYGAVCIECAKKYGIIDV